MVIERFLREMILAALLVMGFAAMSVWAAPQALLTKKAAIKTIEVEKTYLDRFRSAVESEITNQLSKSMNAKSSDFSVNLESLRVTPALPDLSNYSVQVLGLGSEGANRFDGMLTLTVLVNQGRVPLELTVSALMKVLGPVVLAKQTLARGRMIDANDLETKILPWKNLPTGAAGIVKTDYIGRRVKSSINIGSPVWSGLLEEQMAIRSGDQVEITVLSGPGVIIHSRGVARADGRMGELIRIEQPDTRKILSATVVGNKSVEVRL